MQTINLNLYEKTIIPVLCAKQGDVGRKFKAVITDGGEGYQIPAGAVFSVWYSGSSGEGNYTAIGNRSAFNIDGNAVTVELITQMLANAGAGLMCLVMNSADGSQLATWNIPYVAECLPGAGSAAAQQYYTAFSENVRRSESAAQTAELAAGNATGVLANSVRMMGDINSMDALPTDEACLFRALDSNWGGVLPSIYAAYARLRSGRDGNYTTWLGGNGSDLYYTMTSDGDKPTAESWKRIAFTNEVVQPADMAAALAQKAPAGFGYGETMTYLIESKNLNTRLDEILSTMADQTAKQIQIYDQSFSNVAYICTLWRFTGDYAVVDAVSYGGYRAVKCKWGGVWYPWTWENPPLFPGHEYRTTQMWNGKTVHVKALQGAMPSGSASIELPIMNGSQIVSIDALYYVSGEDCAYFFNVGESATLSTEFNTLQLYYAGSEEANYRIIVKYVED